MAGWMAIYGSMNQSKAIYGGWWSNIWQDGWQYMAEWIKAKQYMTGWWSSVWLNNNKVKEYMVDGGAIYDRQYMAGLMATYD